MSQIINRGFYAYHTDADLQSLILGYTKDAKENEDAGRPFMARHSRDMADRARTELNIRYTESIDTEPNYSAFVD